MKKTIIALIGTSIILNSCQNIPENSKTNEINKETNQVSENINNIINNNESETNIGKFGVAITNSPIFYTPNIDEVFGGTDGVSLKFDDYGEIDELEFIALTGSVFNILDEIQVGENTIYKVYTEEYPYQSEKGYFIDSRFLKIQDNKPLEREKESPKLEEIIEKLKKAENSIYTWGGNTPEGVEEIYNYYSPKGEIEKSLEEQWKLKGVDCSGLLYYATNGYTPRNTSNLINFGESVEIEGLNKEEIIKKLKPLDIIVWGGHMIIVLNNEETIESKLDYEKDVEGFQGGVKIRNIDDSLTEVMESRIPVNNYKTDVPEGKNKFVIRRWF